MKIKNALRAKLWPVGSIKPLNFLYFVLLLIVAIGIGSCKKEILSPKDNFPPSSNVNMGTIAYGDFLREVNVNSLGFLKPKLNNSNSKNKLLSIADNNEFGNLAIYTDSISRIIHEGDTSYVFKMALTSKRAISFRNLTIRKNDGKTSAFIATYTPKREWIDARKQGRKIDFKGDMAFTELNLDGINLTQALSFDNSTGSTGKIMSASGNKKMLAQQICSLYAIYTTTPYGCSYGGHMPWDENCPWNLGGDVPPGDYPAGYTTKVTYFEACETIITPDTGSGGSGGGGGTTPNPPGDYDPCDEGSPTPVSKVNGNGFFKLALLPPSDCDDGTLPPVILEEEFDENAPIVLPEDFDIEYPSQWFSNEDELDAISLLIAQEGVGPSSFIPEMYYINGVKVDMLNAPPLNGRTTAKGFPSNHRYFWKQVIEQKPQMFSKINRQLVLDGKSPIVDAQWIKYNPTHKAYLNNPLRHHHEGQGRFAYAIPEKVHQKWSAILHQYRTSGKIPRLAGRLNSIGGIFQLLTIMTDIQTGNPDAWVNWYGSHDEVGKLYKEPYKNFYFEITKQTLYRNAEGKVVRAIVTYNAYDDYVWDADEHKYMGVLKIGTYVEDIDVINKTSANGQFISN